MNFFRKTIKGAFVVVLSAVAIAIVALIAVIITASLSQPQRGNTDAELLSPPPPYVQTENGPASEPEDSQASGNPQPPEHGTEGVLPTEAEGQEAPEIDEPPAADSGEDDNNASEPGAEQLPESPAPQPVAAPPIEAVAPDEGTQAAINNIAKKHGAIGVQVAVIKGGEVVGAYDYGYATRSTSPMTADTKIRIASLSKVILSMLVMRLAELDQLDIDADIGEYWGADVRNPNHRDTPITMRHMLSHTSSIRVYDYGFAAGGELIRSRFLDGSCFARSAPGEIGSWNYNNYAFAALGVTVEVATGETVNSSASRYLFDPLGIDAAFGSGSIVNTDKLATLYTNGGGVGRSLDAQRRSPGSTYPGERGDEFPGGLTISAYDYAKLISVLANRGECEGVRILSPESVAVMESSQGRTGGFDQCLPMRRRSNLFGEDQIFFHTGSNFGVFSLASYNPINGNGVVVLTTGASGARDANGIYAVCSEISESIYAGIRN